VFARVDRCREAEEVPRRQTNKHSRHRIRFSAVQRRAFACYYSVQRRAFACGAKTGFRLLLLGAKTGFRLQCKDGLSPATPRANKRCRNGTTGNAQNAGTVKPAYTATNPRRRVGCKERRTACRYGLPCSAGDPTNRAEIGEGISTRSLRRSMKALRRQGEGGQY
jgi:hypothetical protein